MGIVTDISDWNAWKTSNNNSNTRFFSITEYVIHPAKSSMSYVHRQHRIMEIEAMDILRPVVLPSTMTPSLASLARRIRRRRLREGAPLRSKVNTQRQVKLYWDNCYMLSFTLIVDVTNRNPVTGNGVDSWDCRPSSRNNTPRIHTGSCFRCLLLFAFLLMMMFVCLSRTESSYRRSVPNRQSSFDPNKTRPKWFWAYEWNLHSHP